jgi:hypothetical protein
MLFPRLPRFKRQTPSEPIPIRERDREIINLIYEHRFFQSTQITSLLEGSRQPILRRLQLLYHHGYLERPRAQLDYYHKGGSRPIVYGLGNKGSALLAKERGIPIGKVRWGEKNRAVSRIFLEHALCVSEVMVKFELACRKSTGSKLLMGDDLHIPGAMSQNRCFNWNVQLNPNERPGIIPDATFAIECQTPSDAPDRRVFFLEADRGTMPVIRRNLSQTSMFRKLLAYEATWTQGLHRSQFGFHRFRVLTVTSSPERLESLVNACSKLKRGHGLFLFADRKSVEMTEDILTMPWRSGRNEITTLLE